MPYSSSWGKGIFIGRTLQERGGSYTPSSAFLSPSPSYSLLLNYFTYLLIGF